MNTKYLLIVLLSFLYIDAQAQSTRDYIVISQKLNVRERPSLKSSILGVLENGESVHSIDLGQNESSVCETIQDNWGCWIKIKYGYSSGYVFSTYLGSEYMLLYENSEIQYYPQVNYWYGVYYDSTSQSEILMEVETFAEQYTHEYDDKNHIVLRTKKQKKSLFLIATNIKQESRTIGIFTKTKAKSMNYSGYLSPGTKEWLYFKTKNNTVASECYYLLATGTYTMSKYGLMLEGYELFVADNEPRKSSFAVIQNLTSTIEYNQGFTLEYCGDIDGDGNPDVIIGSCSNSGCTSALLLSSKAKIGELLGLASSYATYDDC
ncbi:MAG: SH3 domain-containing protein [Saprospiraceae bacterium]|nr:SH3 domain-containing protein [Saprospiraceae bacterium]